MLRIREAVVVEGKYDRARLLPVLDAPIVVTGGFRVFKDTATVDLLRRLAAERGLVILTDSDAAGFVIRNYLSGCIPPDRIKHAYCPTLAGKERRKAAPSAEGLLGVEGVDTDLLLDALRRAGVTVTDGAAPVRAAWLDRMRMYEDGLIGRQDSARRRRQLAAAFGLPAYLSAERLREAVEQTVSEQEYVAFVEGKDG